MKSLNACWHFSVLLLLPLAASAQNRCESVLIGGDLLTLNHIAEGLSPESASALESAVQVTSDGGIIEYNSEGHPFEEPYHLNIAVEGATFGLGSATSLSFENGVTTAISEVRLSTGRRSGFMKDLMYALWDALLTHPDEPTPAGRAHGAPNSFIEQTEIRFATRQGKTVYFEAWTRRIFRFHTSVIKHVRLGQP